MQHFRCNMVDILRFRCIFVLEITTQSTCDFTKEEWDNKVRKEKRLNQTNMKLFYVDQFNKVQEFNGTDEEKMALASARNLYTRKDDAISVIMGDKRRMPYSAFIGSPAPVDMWIVNGPFMYVKQLGSMGLDLNTDILQRLKLNGNLFETEEAARAAAEKIRKTIKDEKCREYYELHVQPTQTQSDNNQQRSHQIHVGDERNTRHQESESPACEIHTQILETLSSLRFLNSRQPNRRTLQIVILNPSY